MNKSKRHDAFCGQVMRWLAHIKFYIIRSGEYMQVRIYKARDINLLKTEVQKLCDEGTYIEKVKFESFGDNGRKLLVYFTEGNSSMKQEVVIVKKNITGTINLLNKELNTSVACLDTIPFDTNGLMAIIVKDLE